MDTTSNGIELRELREFLAPYCLKGTVVIPAKLYDRVSMCIRNSDHTTITLDHHDYPEPSRQAFRYIPSPGVSLLIVRGVNGVERGVLDLSREAAAANGEAVCDTPSKLDSAASCHLVKDHRGLHDFILSRNLPDCNHRRVARTCYECASAREKPQPGPEPESSWVPGTIFGEKPTIRCAEPCDICDMRDSGPVKLKVTTSAVDHYVVEGCADGSIVVRQKTIGDYLVREEGDPVAIKAYLATYPAVKLCAWWAKCGKPRGHSGACRD